MLTADPLRTPSYTAFAQPDYYVQDQSSTSGSLFSCATSMTPSAACVKEVPGFNWNHGNVQPQISTTWLGLVGPGVLAKGLDGPDPVAEAQGVRFGTFADHTDLRPTMLKILGLQDDYTSDGRVLLEALNVGALPFSLRQHHGTLVQLGGVYKQLNASVGQFGLDTLRISTAALESNSSGDSTFTSLENQLISYGSQRNTLTSQMISMLEQAEFNGQSIDQQQALSLISQGQVLLAQVHAEAQSV
jgi:hypothetical protein